MDEKRKSHTASSLPITHVNGFESKAFIRPDRRIERLARRGNSSGNVGDIRTATDEKKSVYSLGFIVFTQKKIKAFGKFVTDT